MSGCHPGPFPHDGGRSMICNAWVGYYSVISLLRVFEYGELVEAELEGGVVCHFEPAGVCEGADVGGIPVVLVFSDIFFVEEVEEGEGIEHRFGDACGGGEDNLAAGAEDGFEGVEECRYGSRIKVFDHGEHDDGVGAEGVQGGVVAVDVVVGAGDVFTQLPCITAKVQHLAIQIRQHLPKPHFLQQAFEWEGGVHGQLFDQTKIR